MGDKIMKLREEIDKMVRLETNVFYAHREKAKAERIKLEKELRNAVLMMG